MIKLLHGDCLNVLPTLADNSVDSIVTDPPYGLSFLHKKWDYAVPSIEIWKECLRVLKPGGHLLCFAGTRTQHRMCVNIEDAGFEIRDLISWIYGTGFPKNHNIAKALDKKAEAKAAKKYEGWGSALKPSTELITVARKPFKGTIAANVLEYGTGGINIDGCRVPSGRWPANLILQHLPECRNVVEKWNCTDGCPVAVIDEQSLAGGMHKAGNKKPPKYNVKHGLWVDGGWKPLGRNPDMYADSGGASRFFYCAKASKTERTENRTIENSHPTVKPIKLMQYLCRLVTPEGGTVLDPFAGSGSTGKAARLEGFSAILVEMEEEYIKIAEERLGVTVEEHK